jgi:hypothetical protein
MEPAWGGIVEEEADNLLFLEAEEVVGHSHTIPYSAYLRAGL